MDEDDEREFIALFEDGRAIPVTGKALLAWCHDGHGWLNFLRGIFDDAYAPEMTVQVPMHGLQSLKIVPAQGFKRGATYAEPFNGRTKPG